MTPVGALEVDHTVEGTVPLDGPDQPAATRPRGRCLVAHEGQRIVTGIGVWQWQPALGHRIRRGRYDGVDILLAECPQHESLGPQHHIGKPLLLTGRSSSPISGDSMAGVAGYPPLGWAQLPTSQGLWKSRVETTRS